MPVILHMICLLHHASCHENAQRTSARNSIVFASLDFCRGSSNACYCSLKSFFLGFNESTIILLVVVINQVLISCFASPLVRAILMRLPQALAISPRQMRVGNWSCATASCLYTLTFASKIFNGLISGSLAGAPCYT